MGEVSWNCPVELYLQERKHVQILLSSQIEKDKENLSGKDTSHQKETSSFPLHFPPALTRKYSKAPHPPSTPRP